MASGSPAPAFSALAPSAAKRPVPIIIAAVRNGAVVRPMVRANELPDAPSPLSAVVAMIPSLRSGRSLRHNLNVVETGDRVGFGPQSHPSRDVVVVSRLDHDFVVQE